MMRVVVLLCVTLQILQIGMTARIKLKQQSGVTDQSGNPIVEGTAIIANAYHVSKSWQMRWLNNVLFAGGAYHVAIEAFGYEIGYGATSNCDTERQRAKSGMYTVEPKNDPSHQYFWSEPLGHVNMTEDQFKQSVQELSVHWKGCDYDLLNHNCVSFAQALAYKLLGADAILPAWMSRLMGIGDTLSPALPVLGAMSHASSKSSEAVSYVGGQAIEGSKVVGQKVAEGSVATGQVVHQAVIDFQAARERARIEAMQQQVVMQRPTLQIVQQAPGTYQMVRQVPGPNVQPTHQIVRHVPGPHVQFVQPQRIG